MQTASRLAECVRTELQRCKILCRVYYGRVQYACGVLDGSAGRSGGGDNLTCFVLFVVTDSSADGEHAG